MPPIIPHQPDGKRARKETIRVGYTNENRIYRNIKKKHRYT